MFVILFKMMINLFEMIAL